MRSAFWMVDRRWATMIHVLPLLASSNASCTTWKEKERKGRHLTCTSFTPLNLKGSNWIRPIWSFFLCPQIFLFICFTVATIIYLATGDFVCPQHWPSHSRCQVQRWPRPGAALWGCAEWRGLWLCAASGRLTAELLYHPPECRTSAHTNERGRDISYWYMSKIMTEASTHS